MRTADRCINLIFYLFFNSIIFLFIKAYYQYCGLVGNVTKSCTGGLVCTAANSPLGARFCVCPQQSEHQIKNRLFRFIQTKFDIEGKLFMPCNSKFSLSCPSSMKCIEGMCLCELFRFRIFLS